MLPILNKLQIETINYIIKKNSTWIYYGDNQALHEISDIDSFLSINTQFVKISAYVIVNLNYVEGYLINGTSGFMVLSGRKFDVTRRYISQVRTAQKTFLYQKYYQMDTSDKSKWLSKTTVGKEQLKEINVENILYLERKGTITIVYYNDGTKRSFYETLKYFERIFTNNSFLIRIRRNCIINMKYVQNYRANSETKTAEINIESQKFNVSRRILPTFKRRLKSI